MPDVTKYRDVGISRCFMGYQLQT